MNAATSTRLLSRATLRAPWPVHGIVDRVTGILVESRGPAGSLGDSCRIECSRAGRQDMQAEIVGFRGATTLLMPLGELTGITPGDRVRLSPQSPTVPCGDGLRGRVIDELGRPIDGLGPLLVNGQAPLHREPPSPLARPRIRERLTTGVRAIDGLLTCGRGQRVGIFAGSGVGKSTLLGMIARNTNADLSVIALVGERGREVREFIEEELGPEGLARSVVIAVTSDRSPLQKKRAALLATAVAESFRDRGLDVLLMMDSLTRVAMAQREIGLSAGEPPTSKGYTPSVFTLLPTLLERAGTSDAGSITAFYTVLVDGDDLMDPIADAARSILDGHIVLSRKLADRGRYPAIDCLASISRLMSVLASHTQKQLARKLLKDLAVHEDALDLVQVGAYQKGSSAEIDGALARMPRIEAFLAQAVADGCGFETTLEQLEAALA
ncbi:MAG: FliI/YscN family ATPase [Candidatus Delongbacteria bacterium]|nr:FliI/YscN family ATPase [Candidatus Cloacimonadota bacterium]MCB9474730.1 FliI/YscN family ATPase [Candidatus Delongbacteria bacterium]